MLALGWLALGGMMPEAMDDARPTDSATLELDGRA
jgi:hypothetical protein